ncbi:hypothetical protein ACDQ55_00860 [Chitinophaga sp. 30R24]|uniref:hypothetical protein n=1 Tax=Chitinophaga sp. 30R24 TaxID=3248838 RepID=UPI003B91BA5D
MNTLLKYFLFAVGMLLLHACTKEEAKLPYSSITSFTFTDANGAPLSAAISGQDIIIYWPFEQPLPTGITPQIAVSDEAVIKPASGAKVALSAATSYTVTAQSGSTTIYHLKIVAVQPSPDVKFLQADGYTFFYTNEETSFPALFLIQDTVRTHLSLLSCNGKKIPVAIKSITRDNIMYKYPAALDSGRYKLVLETGKYTITGKTDYYYRPNEPEFEIVQNLQLKRGQTFTLKGKYLDEITSAIMYSDVEAAITVVSNTGTEATFRIPDNMPTGTYDGIAILDRYYRYDNYYYMDAPLEIIP